MRTPESIIIYVLKNGNGNIKEYNDDGKLLFEGEYLNGERNGKWKEYWGNDNLVFESEYLNGKRIDIIPDNNDDSNDDNN